MATETRPEPIKRGFHSIRITSKDGQVDRHTWRDWHLIPTSRPIFPPPGVKTKSVDVPAANGAIDISEILTGYPLYSNRSGSFEFIVIHDPVILDGDYSDEPYPFVGWDRTYQDMCNTLHGRTFYATLDDDPKYSYYGRFGVSEWKSGREFSNVSLSFEVEPFKLTQSSLDDYEWDPFYFGVYGTSDQGDMAQTPMKNISINSILPVSIDISDYTELSGSIMRITPTITSNTSMFVTYNEKSFLVPQGTNKIYGLVINPVTDPVGHLTFSSALPGTISIDFRKGYL